MFVDVTFQRRGIGTEVIKRLFGEANEFNLAVRLNVVRINPARRLYERLGFRVTREDDRKLSMVCSSRSTSSRSEWPSAGEAEARSAEE